MSPSILWHNASVTRARREQLHGHRGAVLWFTGLSGSGKSTLAHSVEEQLYQRGCRTYVLDGDNVRHGLCADLEFTPKNRTENIRRIGEVAKLFTDAATIVLTAFISPYNRDRDLVRRLLGGDNFIEVYCRCPLEICESRDVKGLYRRARAGEIMNFTGISAPYEEPVHPDLVIDSDKVTLDQCVEAVIRRITERGIISNVRSTSG